MIPSRSIIEPHAQEAQRPYRTLPSPILSKRGRLHKLSNLCLWLNSLSTTLAHLLPARRFFRARDTWTIPH